VVYAEIMDIDLTELATKLRNAGFILIILSFVEAYICSLELLAFITYVSGGLGLVGSAALKDSSVWAIIVRVALTIAALVVFFALSFLMSFSHCYKL
jgi:hypothetical protein